MASQSPARLAGIGVFVAGGLLLFTVALFMIGDRQMLFDTKVVVFTEFAKITGLQDGSIVRVSGAMAGAVKDIEPPKDPSGKFRVQFEISEELRQLVRTDSVASIETEGLIGGSFLAISTGSPQASQAPPGSTIPSTEPFQMAELFQQMSATITRVDGIIEDLKGGLEEALVSVDETVKGADELIDEITDEVRTMASAGARISGDIASITEGVRKGEGTIGRLVKDDELYRRATNIARQAEEIAGDAQRVVQQARQAIENFQSQDGPVAGLTTGVTETLTDARDAMAAFADNMEALRHNFLLRGFFNDRGYFDLADISPADYRNGALTADGERQATRIWLHDRVVFQQKAGTNGDSQRLEAEEELTEDGRRRLDSAIAPYLEKLPGGVLMVEGYAQGGSRDERFLRSRRRAAAVRDYLIGKFQLDPRTTGLMALGGEAVGNAPEAQWSGVALALFVEKP
jgi:phospholipid/cholesterol/gamma-HCH transport system substrate-binding protein